VLHNIRKKLHNSFIGSGKEREEGVRTGSENGNLYPEKEKSGTGDCIIQNLISDFGV